MMKEAKIADIKQYVDIKNERTTYIYLVNGVWMLERQVIELMEPKNIGSRYKKAIGVIV